MRKIFSWMHPKKVFFWWFPDRLNKQTEELRFLQLLETAMSHQVSVEVLLQKVSPGLSRSWKGMYERLVFELEAGRPIHEILQPTSLVLPLANPRESFIDPANLVSEETLAWLTVGHETGILQELIHERIEQLKQMHDRQLAFARPGVLGMSVMVFVCFNMVVFVRIWCVAALFEIFRNFGFQPGRGPMIWFVNVTEIFFNSQISVFVMPLSFLLLLFVFGFGSQTGQHPVQRWMFPFRGRPTFLTALGMAIKKGKDILPVAESIGLFHPSKPMRRKSQQLKAKMEFGEDFPDSMLKCGFLNQSQANWLAKAEKTGRQGQVLILLGKRAADRELRFWSLINRCVEILLMLMIAVTVFLMGMMVFTVITTIITG